MELNQLVTQWKAASDETEGDVNNTDEWKYDGSNSVIYLSVSHLHHSDFISLGLNFFFPLLLL